MAQKKHAKANSRKGERGNVLAYTVISALFLFMAVGLGVDLSHLYQTKTELQNTADAAALAGASAMNLPPADRITKAVDRAIEVMNMNRYNFDNRTYENVTTKAAQRALVTFAKNLNDSPYLSEADAAADAANMRFVKVATPSVPVSIFFAIPIMGSSTSLSARATAGLSIPGNVNFCPAPLAVIDCGNLGAACKDADGNEVHLGGVCGADGPTDNPDNTPCDPDKQLCRNCVYTIRAAPNSGPAPGNYHGLCCPNQTCDAEWIRQRLAGSQNCDECPPIDPGEEIAPTTKPGVNAGPIRQGINTRFDIYNGGTPPLNPVDHPPDPNIWPPNATDTLSYEDYQNKVQFLQPSHDWKDDRRILDLPITPFDTWNDANGRTTVKVSALGAFFLQRRVGLGNDGEIKAEYIGERTPAQVGFNPGAGNAANIVTPVLYR